MVSGRGGNGKQLIRAIKGFDVAEEIYTYFSCLFISRLPSSSDITTLD